ncbi:MAG: hypothetical protein JWQ89_3326 [Devosia sp.]|nr:hypothetical protein [Devosia sp.]
MGLCRDCKWWLRQDRDIGVCERAEVNDSKLQPWPREYGDDGETTLIKTMADFGCVQFEEKAQ